MLRLSLATLEGELGGCPYCSPSGLQACTHPPKGMRKERAMREKEREGITKGKGVLFKELQTPTLAPK